MSTATLPPLEGSSAMSPADPVPALNRLLRTLYRSLPMYLAEARPWMRRGSEQPQAVLAGIAADQQAQCGRLAECIRDHGGALNLGEFPMEFTDLHDLSIDYLLRHAGVLHAAALEAIACAAAQLPVGTPERALADEIEASAQRHGETLKAIAG